MPPAIILLVGGLVILWKCADLLIAGAVSLAVLLGVTPLVVGLTIVAMGTSAPEAAASIAGAFRENGGDLAIGNVFGSNIAILALVGGVIALMSPLIVQKRTPDISSVIQELVNQNALAGTIVLTFTDNPAKPSEGTREAESFDGGADEAPLLHTSYQ